MLGQTIAPPRQESLPLAAPNAPKSPVERISAMLEAEKRPPKEPAVKPEPAPEAAAEPQQTEPQGAEPEPVAEPAPNAQVEGADAPLEIPLDQLEAAELETTVKGEDGKDVVEKLTVKELKLGYMRNKDYHRKTAEVARQREEVGEKVRQAVEGERTAYQNTLQQLQTIVIETVAPELKNVDWNHLAANDPLEYVRVRNRADQIKNMLDGIQSKQAELTQKQKQEAAQSRQKAAQLARETLEKAIPDWSDDHYQALMKTATEYGYKANEVAAWIDPKAFQVLHDANEYRKLKSGKPVEQKKVVVAPKVIPPSATKPTQAQQKSADAMKRLQSSGRIEDAAAVIRSRLG